MFQSFSIQPALDTDLALAEIPVKYSSDTDTNISVYDKDSSRQVPAGGLTKYMTIALLLTNYADQLDNTFQMPFAISDYVHNSDNADMRSNETFTYREAVYACLLYTSQMLQAMPTAMPSVLLARIVGKVTGRRVGSVVVPS